MTEGLTSDANHWERAIHAEDGSADDWEWRVIGSTHLTSGSDDKAADEKSEEDDGDSLSGSESKRHDR